MPQTCQISRKRNRPGLPVRLTRRTEPDATREGSHSHRLTDAPAPASAPVRDSTWSAGPRVRSQTGDRTEQSEPSPPRRPAPKFYINAAEPPSRKPPSPPPHSPHTKTRGSASPPKRGRRAGASTCSRCVKLHSLSLSFPTPIPHSRWPRLDPRRRGHWEAGSVAVVASPPPPGRPPESACGCSTARCTSARWRCSR